MRKKIEKRILITLQNGSMYRFAFNLLWRDSISEMVFKDRHYHRLKDVVVNIHTGNDGLEKKERVSPDKNIEIRMISGFQQFLRKGSDFSLVFLDKYTYSDDTFDYYINYPGVLTDFDKAFVVVENWSINFLDYILNAYNYNPDLSWKYSEYWSMKRSMRRARNRTQIEKIEFI